MKISRFNREINRRLRLHVIFRQFNRLRLHRGLIQSSSCPGHHQTSARPVADRLWTFFIFVCFCFVNVLMQ